MGKLKEQMLRNNETDNYLPPDNYQHEPRGVIAHRTSPTNIGLYLLSVLAAHDFGVARQFLVDAHQAFGNVDQGIEPVQAAQQRGGGIGQRIAAAGVGAFVGQY